MDIFGFGVVLRRTNLKSIRFEEKRSRMGVQVVHAFNTKFYAFKTMHILL